LRFFRELAIIHQNGDATDSETGELGWFNRKHKDGHAAWPDLCFLFLAVRSIGVPVWAAGGNCGPMFSGCSLYGFELIGCSLCQIVVASILASITCVLATNVKGPAGGASMAADRNRSVEPDVVLLL
jgi:hypothetical protein